MYTVIIDLRMKTIGLRFNTAILSLKLICRKVADQTCLASCLKSVVC